MAAPPSPPPVADRPEPPSAAYLASQRWTPDRVQAELVQESRPWPRYELIAGELLVSPAPRWSHQRVIGELLTLLHPYVERHGLGEVLFSPADVRLTPTSMGQPDLFVVPPSSMGDDWRDIAELSLVIEVLSPSTARYDRVIKRAYYAERGVPAYWVVDYDGRRFEVSTPAQADVEYRDREVTWHPAGAPEPLVIDVTALFDRVAARERRTRGG